MAEITPPITQSTNTNTSDNITTTIIPPNVPSDNSNSSEYQRSFSWKLPMVKVNRPKERTKSEYQREFTWKNESPSTPSPAPSPAPVTPSPIPQELTCNTPEPVKPTTTTTTNNNTIDFIGSKLNDLNITSNNNFVSEPEEYTFNTNNNVPDKWKDGLRSKNTSEPRQSALASSLDPKTKKIVALEANRLSKKSRSYSMYSLHDQLKVNEAANDLSNPFDTEYNREFVNWKEYGTVVREDTMASKKRQTTDNHTLKRRGSWSAPSSSLPAPLKWLEDMNILGSRGNTREKLQPTITDAKSIRGISTTITAKSHLTRDYYYDEKRPTTSAEFRDYRHYERPKTSADVRDYSRPMTSLHDDDDYYYDSKRNSNIDLSYSKKSRNPSPLRSSTTLGYYKDTNVTSKYYDDREHNISNVKDYDRKDYDRRDYDKRDYDRKDYERKDYDRKDYDYYDNYKYDDRKRDDIYDDYKRENVYDDRRRDFYDDHRRDNVHDDRRRDNNYDDRQRDNSSYDHEFHRRDNNNNYNYEEYDSKYNSRAIHTSDHEHFNPGHSRNTSYASSSNKGSLHDEPTNFSGAPLTYLDAMRHRSSVSSLSSASTPSLPATPIGYDMNDMRWKRNNGLDPRIYKEQNYSPSIISKSSSSSHKYWQFEDEKDKYYHPSALSPSRSKFYIDDDEEHDEGYSSKRQSRDYKPLNSSSMRYSSQYSPTPTRSTSPSRDSYGSGRRHYHKSSRPPSRATSVSSHATSIEEESAVLTDLLKEAEIMTLKNLTDQMNIFKSTRDLGVGVGSKGVKGVKGIANSGRATPGVSGRATPGVSGRATPAVSGRATPAVSGRATPSVTAAKRSSLGGQKKPTTTATTTTRAGVKSKTTPTTKTPTRTSKNSSTPVIPPNKKKGHRPASSLSSLSSTSSYREAYQPPPTNFSAARDALNKARMKVEEMLEIVSNGGSLD